VTWADRHHVSSLHAVKTCLWRYVCLLLRFYKHTSNLILLHPRYVIWDFFSFIIGEISLHVLCFVCALGGLLSAFDIGLCWFHDYNLTHFPFLFSCPWSGLFLRRVREPTCRSSQFSDPFTDCFTTSKNSYLFIFGAFL
jgi:hypothetical protein